MYSEQRQLFYSKEARDALSKSLEIPEEKQHEVFEALEQAAGNLKIWRGYEKERSDHTQRRKRLEKSVGRIQGLLAEIDPDVLAYFLNAEADALGIARGEKMDPAFRKIDPYFSPQIEFSNLEEYLVAKSKLQSLFDKLSKADVLPTPGTKPDSGLTIWALAVLNVWQGILGRSGFSPGLSDGEPSNEVTYFASQILSEIEPEVAAKTVAHHMREALEMEQLQRQQFSSE